MKEDGVIKFNCEWIERNTDHDDIIEDLNFWRARLYDKHLIGVYSNGIGYGNLSVRLKGNTFIISGTSTGKLNKLQKHHYTTVTRFDFESNSLTCEGPIMASSESLTHAAVYKSLPWVQAVVHAHDRTLWKKLLGVEPTTDPAVTYGTPEMAWETARIVKKMAVDDDKLLVMGGHEEGIISMGSSLKEAATRMLNFHGKFHTL